MNAEANEDAFRAKVSTFRLFTHSLIIEEKKDKFGNDFFFTLIP